MIVRINTRLAVGVAALASCAGLLRAGRAGERSGRYAGAILAEKALAAYWRMEGDLKDQKAAAAGVLRGGAARFVDGPAGGRALALDKGQFVTMGQAPHLDLPQTTVELLFQLTARPPEGYNPCLVAKRSDSPATRFSVHVMRGLGQLAVWNGRSVILIDPPAGPLKVGQWYHLAVAADRRRLAVYLDGLACTVRGGGSFSFAAKRLPLQLGASDPQGREQCLCALDEVAIYSRVLSEQDVDRHVEALGWGEKKRQLLRRMQAREADRKRARREKLAERLGDARLFARGRTRVYRGEHLEAVSLPLGGVGGGCLQINGKAERHIWQIFNNFQPVALPHSFFAVRAKPQGAEPVIRAVQTAAVGPFPAMKALTFRGEYPFGWFDFQDAALPVRVSMEAFSPLIPMDAKHSALPCAVFRLTAENASATPVEVSFLAAQQNAVGLTAGATTAARNNPGYGGNRNEVLPGGGSTILHMTGPPAARTPASGDMALLARGGDVTASASWDALAKLAADFAADGRLTGPRQAGPSPKGQTVDGALAASVTLRPGQKRTVTFVLTWHFPHGRGGAGRRVSRPDQPTWLHEGRMYATWWPNALAVGRYLAERLDELTGQTRAYHDALYATNLPYWLLDRISSQAAVLKSPTCFWARDGYFGGWEGCCRSRGCCHGNCAHVWHYAQAHARLLPEIGRRMREQSLSYQNAAGGIPFRHPAGKVAFDGQCGEILGAYREHLCSADGTWLARHWPRIRKAMDFAVATWDRDEDGVPAGAQHNTLDGELGGSTTWLGGLYLAALAASERMALRQGQDDLAERYRRIRASGAKKQDETLFNGRYYVQVPDPTPRQDYGNGCAIDQMLGQWWAHQLDLGWLYPPDRVRTALRSLFGHNFRTDFRGVPQRPRKFVADDDAGMQMICWPKGDRPARHILYADEVMSGFEYSAAAAMVQAGLPREAFVVVLAASDRYDGRLRTGLAGDLRGGRSAWGYSGNPFGDDECGKFYARPMSVWAMLLACQGFVYDGPAGVIGFRPAWRPEDHRSFFTAAEGWGLFSQRIDKQRQTEQIHLRYGRLALRELRFELPAGIDAGKVTVLLGEKALPATFRTDGRGLRVTLARPVVLEAGAELRIDVALAPAARGET